MKERIKHFFYIKSLNTIFKIIFFCLGSSLLTLNISSIFFTIRNETLDQNGAKELINKLNSHQNSYNKIINYEESISRLNRSDLTRNEYLIFSTETIHQSIIHYFPSDKINSMKFNSWIPITENYILYTLGFFHEKLRTWEIYNYKKAIERGIGLCNQHAIILDQLLKEKGIESKLIGLDGHVIATAKNEEGLWWLLDPNYGVTVPFSLEDVQKQPSLIEKYYQKEGYSKERINKISKMFNANSNFIGKDWYARNQRYKNIIYSFSEYLKWIIPFILIFSCFINSKLNKSDKHSIKK